MKNIIANIDGHIIKTTVDEYNEAFDLIKNECKQRNMHFDDSPFGTILHLCDENELDEVLNSDLEKHYWTKKIISGKKINAKFDTIDYVKKSFARIQQRQPPVKWMTTKERLAEKRSFDSFWGTFL